jgi:hypothetical protein
LKRMRDQAIFYDTLYGMVGCEERGEKRLFDLFVRLRGIRWFAQKDAKEVLEKWEEFKWNGKTTVEDWQCLFI